MLNNPNDITLLAYDPRRDTNWLKEEPERFEGFRNNYQVVREAEIYYQARDKYITCFMTLFYGLQIYLIQSSLELYKIYLNSETNSGLDLKICIFPG